MSVSMEELEQLLLGYEDEHLEFKEAKARFNFEELVKYCVAFANEGGGRIILGVTDARPRRVVGSNAFELERVKKGLIGRLRLRVEVDELSHPDGRVMIVTIPARPVGCPISDKGAYWMRAGEELIPMTSDQLKRICAEGEPDFTAQPCPGATMDDLDVRAIEEFRSKWVERSKRAELIELSLVQLLNDAELALDNKITYAALILFGTHEALGRLLSQAELIFEYRSDEASIAYLQREEYRKGFLLFHDDLWKTIELRNDRYSIQDGLYRRVILAFNEAAVREAILNALSHRDYSRAGSIFLKQWPHKIEISSPGGFPAGVTPENILFRQSPRNRRLADALARCGLVERSGQGADRMFSESIREGKLPPDFSDSDPHQVAVVLSGQVQDEQFSAFLKKLSSETQRALSLDDLVVLDAIHRDIQVPERVLSRLPGLVSLGALDRLSTERVILSNRLYSSVSRPLYALASEAEVRNRGKVGSPAKIVLPVNNLPASLGDLFTGREDLLAELEKNLGQPRATALVQAQTVSGLGGVGKTRLAIELAHRHAGDYSGIFFVNADSPSELRRNLAALAGRLLLNLNLPETLPEDRVVEEVKLALRERPGWLLILDNVDSHDAQAAVCSLFPLDGGHVLITSRLLQWPPDYRQLEVDKLDPQAAQDYLLKATPKRLRSADDQLVAAKLAEKLGFLPLALEVTAAYLRENAISLSELLAGWTEEEQVLLGWLGPGSTTYPRSLAATWARSFEKLSVDAQVLLSFLGHLAPEPIAVALFEAGSKVLNEAMEARELNLKAALAELQSYSLISRESSGKEKSITLHRLVQAVVRGRIPDEDKAIWVERVVLLMLAFVPEDSQDVRGWPIWDPLRPHASRVLELAEEVGAPQPTSRLMSGLGLLLKAKALYSEAEPLIRRALAIDEATFGPDHPDVARDLNNLAELLQDTNRFIEAEPLIRRALTITEASFGPDHPKFAISLSNLAQLLRATNRPADAEPLMRRALAIDEASFGQEHPKVALYLNNLAILLRDTNRLSEAEPLMRRALAIAETSFGPDHPHVATFLNNLAQLLQATNRLAEAGPLMRRALAIFEGSLGADHPLTAKCRLNHEQLLEQITREGQK